MVQPPPAWETITARSKVMSIAFEDHYVWLGLSPSSVFPKGGIIRHDLNTAKDFDLYSIQSTKGGLMSEGVYKVSPSTSKVSSGSPPMVVAWPVSTARPGQTSRVKAMAHLPPNSWTSYPEGASRMNKDNSLSCAIISTRITMSRRSQHGTSEPYTAAHHPTRPESMCALLQGHSTRAKNTGHALHASG